MRINKFVAASTGLSRRAADKAIQEGRVTINGQPAALADAVTNDDIVKLDGKQLQPPATIQTILFNKPAGYVVSRDGQGSQTIYELLPDTLHHLKPIGRLDKNSSGLLLLTNDGELAHQLTHPSFRKVKIYETMLDKPLAPLHRQMINDYGIRLEDGLSQLQLERLRDGDDTQWRVTMHEGRNRQIRRTFAALGYEVTRLHRTQFGSYALASLTEGAWQNI
jgi:23S rRNA pseudouridine2605 synthase